MITNLVVAGGGFKVIRMLGGLKYMEEHKDLKFINSYYGTSAGSLLCLMMSLGYSMPHIIKVFNEHCNDKLLTLKINIDRFFERYSLYDVSKFIKLLRTLIGCKLNPANPSEFKDVTLKELYEKTKKKLTCTVVSLRDSKVKYFNYINQPNLPAYKLVQMSCAIPLIFEPVEWEGDLYIDGGVVDNFPYSAVPEYELPMTLGIGIKSITRSKDISYGDIVSFVSRIANISINHSETRNLHNAIYVSVDERFDDNMIDADITLEERMEMIDAGYNEVKQQLNVKKHVRRKSF
jgi:predicted acylesterase/phospholipase RssA